ncbi:MAG: helix-turn-helix transcriptional regulator [Lachnospiraceae bacterium]|nr:helix-turn-helix transcriptional regulator [Lachnospiraceae bacterium]
MDFQIMQDMETVMELRNLTKDEFAKELGVSRTTVCNWIAGKKDISEKNIWMFYEYTFNKGIRLNKIKEQLYREDLERTPSFCFFMVPRRGLREDYVWIAASVRMILGLVSIVVRAWSSQLCLYPPFRLLLFICLNLTVKDLNVRSLRLIGNGC